MSCVSRLLQEQMEHLLSDVQRRLSVKTNELHATQMHITQLEERLGELLYMDEPRGGEGLQGADSKNNGGICCIFFPTHLFRKLS